MAVIDETHDPELKSWVASANEPGCEFPIQNLPLATFVAEGKRRIGVGIGEFVMDISPWLAGDDLRGFFRMSASDRAALRKDLSKALRYGRSPRPLLAISECNFQLACAVGDYTDFYASIHHATNVGSLFRPNNPLLPNYKYVPIAYHGRSSSIVVSGTPVKRPNGQLGEGKFGPTAELDYEVELGTFVGPANSAPISVDEAEDHLAGFCLLNDWSARDIQRWEYQPLGPFLAKNFATTISPWVVTPEALAPFRSAAPKEDRVEPEYLRSDNLQGFDIQIEAWFNDEKVSSANFASMYWTVSQMLAHHTVNGCPMRAGDLLGSGTVSGPLKENRGCLLELTMNGREPIMLRNAETRTFLQDGDTVRLSAQCEREGFRGIGFGECAGTVVG